MDRRVAREIAAAALETATTALGPVAALVPIEKKLNPNPIPSGIRGLRARLGRL